MASTPRLVARSSPPRSVGTPPAARRCRGPSRSRRGWRSSGCEHGELHRLVALLLAARQVDVERAVEEAPVEADPLRLVTVASSSTRRRRDRPRRDASSRTSDRRTPGTSVGYCMARNSPAWARSHVRQREQVDAVERHRPAGHLVARAAHDHVRQRRLARAVRSHHGVHLAGAHREVDARAGSPARRRSPAGPRSPASLSLAPRLTACPPRSHLDTTSPSTTDTS